jgi:uncharacterized protein (DUF1501 family)
MLRVLGRPAAACDRLSRRELLLAGSIAALGGVAGAKPQAASKADAASKAGAVILIDLFGGPSHLDTFDPKPDAPPEIRGEFATIATPLAGVRVCEHLPQLAKRLPNCTLIRTVSHRYNSHNPYAVMTGFDGGQDQTDYFARPTNHPSVPSVCQYLGVGRGGELPGYVMLPAFPGYSQGLRRAGPYGGYLGPKFDPLFSTCEPKWAKEKVDFYDHEHTAMGEPTLPKCDGGLTLEALNSRRSLVEQLDRAKAGGESLGGKRGEAFDLLTSAKARQAFDLSRESPRTRDRYGRDLFGSSTLLARRLVEAGVTFVTVHTEAAGNGHWDTHSNNFRMLKGVLLPFLDRAVSALLDDLRESGLLERTLVVVNGDMGRSPKVNASAGRDHWPQCGFALLAGGGVKAGLVYGRSDKTAAYPVEHPVSAGDLAATVYHLVGVDPEATVPDQTGRPMPISHGGAVVKGVLA